MGQAGRAWVLEHFVDRRVLGLAAAYYKMLLEPAIALGKFGSITAEPE
jgi:hypothetical protein